ncbi:MAG: VOC family protein, partial [Pseudoxanthomonas sp.]|nr:VOC family protein [Pseudoxanthomonas sp.]
AKPAQLEEILMEGARKARVHLDIETDDIEAEVARLEKLGARKVAFVKRWWVMEAPSGHRFCVVRQQREPFGPHLNRWE